MLTPGTKARDKVTGFEGVATAMKIEFDRSIHYRLETVSRDGQFGSRQWFDASRIEVVAIAAGETPKAEAGKGDSDKTKADRPSVTSLIAMAMALGIVKLVPDEDCNCPLCIRARSSQKTH